MDPSSGSQDTGRGGVSESLLDGVQPASAASDSEGVADGSDVDSDMEDGETNGAGSAKSPGANSSASQRRAPAATLQKLPEDAEHPQDETKRPDGNTGSAKSPASAGPADVDPLTKVKLVQDMLAGFRDLLAVKQGDAEEVG